MLPSDIMKSQHQLNSEGKRMCTAMTKTFQK